MNQAIQFLNQKKEIKIISNIISFLFSTETSNVFVLEMTSLLLEITKWRVGNTSGKQLIFRRGLEMIKALVHVPLSLWNGLQQC